MTPDDDIEERGGLAGHERREIATKNLPAARALTAAAEKQRVADRNLARAVDCIGDSIKSLRAFTLAVAGAAVVGVLIAVLTLCLSIRSTANTIELCELQVESRNRMAQLNRDFAERRHDRDPVLARRLVAEARTLEEASAGARCAERFRIRP